MDIKYPPTTLQILAQCFTGVWSTEKLLMFSYCLSSTVSVSLYRLNIFIKADVNKIPINFTKVSSLKS
jgi:hypothetical protein